jgi:hypothetical protein
MVDASGNLWRQTPTHAIANTSDSTGRAVDEGRRYLLEHLVRHHDDLLSLSLSDLEHRSGLPTRAPNDRPARQTRNRRLTRMPTHSGHHSREEATPHPGPGFFKIHTGRLCRGSRPTLPDASRPQQAPQCGLGDCSTSRKAQAATSEPPRSPAGESASPGSRSRRRQTAHIHRVAQRIGAVKTMARAGPGAIVLSAAQSMPPRRGSSKWA